MNTDSDIRRYIGPEMFDPFIFDPFPSLLPCLVAPFPTGIGPRNEFEFQERPNCIKGKYCRLKTRRFSRTNFAYLHAQLPHAEDAPGIGGREEAGIQTHTRVKTRKSRRHQHCRTFKWEPETAEVT